MRHESNTPYYPSRELIRSQDISVKWMQDKLHEISQHCDADTLSLFGQIASPMDDHVKLALESRMTQRESLLVIIDTQGGIVQIAERIVTILRYHYSEVKFLVPNKAMSAGTVLVMSGDAIIMDYCSCLGPIDPQVYVDEKAGYVSVMSYLDQYNRLVELSRTGSLTTAELVLLEKLDLADLRQYQLAAELSVSLVQSWLLEYKFKNWSLHSSTGIPVTEDEKQMRARDIALALNDQERWHMHSRMIDRNALEDLKLIIDHLECQTELRTLSQEFHWFLSDFASRHHQMTLVIGPTYF